MSSFFCSRALVAKAVGGQFSPLVCSGGLPQTFQVLHASVCICRGGARRAGGSGTAPEREKGARHAACEIAPYRVRRKPRNRTHAKRATYVMRGALEASAPAAPVTSAVRRASSCVSGSSRSLAAQAIFPSNGAGARTSVRVCARARAARDDRRAVRRRAGGLRAGTAAADVPWKVYPPSTLTLPSTLDVPEGVLAAGQSLRAGAMTCCIADTGMHDLTTLGTRHTPCRSAPTPARSPTRTCRRCTCTWRRSCGRTEPACGPTAFGASTCSFCARCSRRLSARTHARTHAQVVAAPHGL